MLFGTIFSKPGFMVHIINFKQQFLAQRLFKSIKRLWLGSDRNKYGQKHPIPFKHCSSSTQVPIRFPKFVCQNTHCNVVVGTSNSLLDFLDSIMLRECQFLVFVNAYLGFIALLIYFKPLIEINLNPFFRTKSKVISDVNTTNYCI